MLVDKK